MTTAKAAGRIVSLQHLRLWRAPSERPKSATGLSSTPYDYVYLHDFEGRFLEANPAALELFGYRAEDVPSLTLSSLLGEDQLPLAAAVMAELRQTGALKKAAEFVLRRKTGELVILETKPTVVSRDGQPYAVLGIARDVTEQRRLAASLHKAQFSVDNVADAVHWVDREGRIVDASLSMCARLGYSRAELLTMSISDITVESPPEPWPDRWRLLKEQGPLIFEKRHRTKRGEIFPVEIWSSIVEYEGEEVALAIARDISERKLAAEAVQKSSDLFSAYVRDSPIYSYIKVVTPTESRVLHASENYRDVLGISSSEMVGKTNAELFPEARARIMTATDWQVVSTGQTLRFEEEFAGRSYTTIKFPVVRGDETLLAGYTIDVTEARGGRAGPPGQRRGPEDLLRQRRRRGLRGGSGQRRHSRLQRQGVPRSGLQQGRAAGAELRRHRVRTGSVSVSEIHGRLAPGHVESLRGAAPAQGWIGLPGGDPFELSGLRPSRTSGCPSCGTSPCASAPRESSRSGRRNCARPRRWRRSDSWRGG